MQRQRSWRTDAATAPHWTADAVARFAEVYARIGNGPTNNRKIAEELGGGTWAASCCLLSVGGVVLFGFGSSLTTFWAGFHPNHVAHFKRVFNHMQKRSTGRY